MRKRDELMLKSGFIPANRAAELSGVTVQTIHRMVKTKRVEGEQVAGRSWYVKVESLAHVYGNVPNIRDAILAVLATIPPPQASAGL